MKDNKILLGLPTGSGYFPHETVQALLRMRKPCPCFVQVVERQRIDKARNYMVKQALDSGSTHLLFIDDDNPVTPDTLEHFLQADKDIVCAPILSRNPNQKGIHELCVFRREKVKEGKGAGIWMYHSIEKLDLSGGHLVKVDGCGMGVTMIRRNVLESHWKKYEGEPFAFGDSTKVNDPNDMDKNQRRTMSEDVLFTERALDEGFEVWCDTRVRPAHLGAPRVYKFSDFYIM